MYSGTHKNPNNIEDSLKHFSKMKEKDINNIRSWHWHHPKARTIEEQKFLLWTSEAVHFTNYEFKWPMLEPTIENGNVRYEQYANVSKWLNYYEWRRVAEMFAPQYNSGIGNLYELYLVYAYRIMHGYWTIEYVCNDSTAEGNFFDSPGKSIFGCESAGERKVGGYFDGIGNTSKIVEQNMQILSVGGNYTHYGRFNPVARVEKVNNYVETIRNATAMIVLRG